jgi:phosphoserine phosphatase RsbU/P
VGGDSFEFLDLGAGRVALAIADVSGKGVAAALLMASLHATLRCLSTTPGTIADRVSRINRMVCESTATGRFATLFYAELDLAERVLRYTNAGHNFPVLLRPGGAVERLETGGVPVGLMSDWKFEEAEVRLSPGDVLLLYSDGVSEAENPRNDQFGEDAVEVVLKSLAHLPCEEIVQSMLRAVSRFAAGAPQTDDQTLVALRVLPD